jgi:hypothetical protein
MSEKDANVLGVKIKDYGECEYCSDEDNKEVLKIPWDIWCQWLYISQRMAGKEWGAVFWVKNSTITEFKIPRQEVSSTECEFKEDLGGDGIVHSHHDLGAFHSSQDDRHARNLYLYSIVIANSSGYAATKRVKLPCKGFGYLRVELRLTGCPDLDLSRITEKTVLSPLSSREETPKEIGFETDRLPCDNCVNQDCQNCAHFYMGQFPCDNCVSFKCKDCQHTRGLDVSEVLPFCDFCEDDESCPDCGKLAGYLENYPEDKERFRHSAVNKTR